MEDSCTDVVTLALRKARYNEIVQIEVNQEEEAEGETREVCLVACLDEQHGGIEWNPLQLDSPEKRIRRHLQTKQWVIPMLNDRRRNELYRQAIAKAVKTLSKPKDEPVTVLDIGAGTGLLSLMAAQALTTSGHSIQTIRAVEMSAAMANLARRVIRDNQLQGQIDVKTLHSSMLDSNPQADICVSELLESGLLGEGLLPSLRDAWDRLLKPDAIVVPQQTRIYAAVVEGDWLSSFHPASLLTNRTGLSFRSMLDATTASSENPVVVPIHAQKLLQESSLRFLTEAERVLTIDLDGKERLPSEDGQNSNVSTAVTQSGTASAILVWWDLVLWRGQASDEDLVYSMKPGAEPFQDHWHQCLHILPRPINVAAGDSLMLCVSHNDFRVQAHLKKPHKEDVSTAKRARWVMAECASTFPLSPQLVFQLNDSKRHCFFKNSILQALASLKGEVHVLDLSDFSWCACLAAQASCHRVTSLESSTSGSLAKWAARVAKDSISFNEGACQFEILACHVESLPLAALGGSPINLVVAEPYFEILEGWPLLEALNYYYMVRFLRSQSAIASDAAVVPTRCRIMACAIESDQLRSAYRCGGDREGASNVCGLGFDHSSLVQLRSNDRTLLSLPMWQYVYRKLTTDFEIGCMHYDKPSDDALRFSSEAVMQERGRVDALMVWLEYQCGNGTTGKDSQTLSTDSRSYQQHVHVLQYSSPLVLEDADAATVHVQLTLGGLENTMDYQITVELNGPES